MEKNNSEKPEKQEELNSLIEQYNIIKSKRNFYISRKDILRE